MLLEKVNEMLHGNRKPGASWWHGRHAPIEYTAIKILEYLDANEPTAFTVNHLMKIGGLVVQRRDRVKWILNRFDGLGWVRVTAENRYMITRVGKEVYWGVGRNVLEFFKVFRLGIDEFPTRELGKKRFDPEEGDEL